MTTITTNPLKRVTSLEFSLINPDDIKRYGVCEVTQIDIYNKDKQANFSGANDPRMGPIDKDALCSTCHMNKDNCPGHFGYITLGEPAFNPLFMNKICDVLNCMCHECGSFIFQLSPEQCKLLLKMSNITRFKKLVKMSKVTYKKCMNCEAKRFKYIKSKIHLEAIHTNPKLKLKIKRDVYASEVMKIFSMMSDNMIELLGFDPETSRPEWMIFTVLPIVPPCVRPSISYGNNLRSEDDMMYKIIDILKANIALTNYRQKPHKSERNFTNNYIEFLQWNATVTIDNNIKGVPVSQHRNSGRPLKTLKERIKGKEGRIRGNILGKRVDFSARSVVDPGPELSIDQIGVPLYICMTLTIPEEVTKYNIDKLRSMVMNGPTTYPGANRLVKIINGKHKYISLNADLRIKPSMINVGDIVHRHLIKNDYVLFNRQPSLHKMSMMGHRIVPIEGRVLRLNPAVCKPYNADFDGDEMNIFLTQNHKSANEVSMITSVTKQLISPQSSSPNIGCIMDNIVGSMILSQDTTFLSEDDMDFILYSQPHKPYDNTLSLTKSMIPDPIDKHGRRWSGKQLISMILPSSLNYQKGDVKIVNGNLIEGILTKSTIGASTNSIIHVIINDIGIHEAHKFIDNIQIITNRFLMIHGFSIGYDDIKISNDISTQIDTILEISKHTALRYIDSIKPNNTSLSNFESFIFGILNKARSDIGSLVMKNIDKNNSLYAMIHSKAKGNLLNISQILGSVGQQNIQHKGSSGRVPTDCNNRSLPYYTQNDQSPDSRGFIRGSYVKGLSVDEFYYHMKAGRDGVIDTACKTADVGYLQRKILKSLEDITVAYDMTVRNEGKRIVQFAFGGCSFDPLRLEKQKLDILMMSNTQFRETYQWKDKTNKKLASREFIDLLNIRHEFQRRQLYKNMDRIMLPININRLIHKGKQNNKHGKHGKPLTIPYIIDQVNDLCSSLLINGNTSDVYPYSELNNYNMLLLRGLIKSKLSSKQIMESHALTKDQFDELINDIKMMYYKSLIHPGEAVGPIAAQSIGEPCTQLSVRGNTKVKVMINGKYMEPSIGNLIDEYMATKNKEVITTHITEDGNPSHVLPIPCEWDIKVPGLNYKTQEVQWKRVTEFSRHPPNGKLVRIRTKSGKTVVATLSHSFVTQKHGKPITTRGDQLKIGDKVPIMK